MDAVGQQFLQQWYQFLQQNTVQVQQLLQEADSGCQQILGTGPVDPLAIQSTLDGVGVRIKDLETRIGSTWAEQVLAQFAGTRDRREPVEQGLQQWESASQWIHDAWERLRCHWMAEGLRHLWPFVQQELAMPRNCTRCGATIEPAARHTVDHVTCPRCNTANTTQPGAKTGLFYALGPDVWAEGAALDLRLELDGFRRQVVAQARLRQALEGERGEEPVESLERWAAMERSYWTRYFAEKATLLPASTDEQDHAVESKLEAVHREINQRAAHRSAEGTEQQLAPVVVPPELENMDEWGPLRPEQYEDFEFHQFLLEESRGEPRRFTEWLRQLGYRDALQYELMRRTFTRNYAPYVGDPRMGQAQSNARQRANQAQRAQTRAADGTSGQYAPGAPMAASAGGPMGGLGSTLGGLGGSPGGRGGAGGEPVPFERFCEIMGAQTAWSRTGRDVNAGLRQVFNLSAADWSSISAYWMSRIPTDMNLARQMTPLTQQYEQRYSQ